MTVRCVECACAGSGKKAPPDIAAKGFACCGHERMPGVYVALLYRRECSRGFVALAPAAVEARVEWLRSQA